MDKIVVGTAPAPAKPVVRALRALAVQQSMLPLMDEFPPIPVSGPAGPRNDPGRRAEKPPAPASPAGPDCFFVEGSHHF